MVFITDGSDLEGVEKPQDIKYMKVLRYSLRMIAAWPELEVEGEESKYHIYKKCYTFFIEFVFLVPGILYLKHNINKVSFFEMGHTYITVFMNIVAICRLVLIFLRKYSNTVGYFVKSIHLFHHKNKSAYAMKTHMLVHKMSHFATMYLSAQMAIGILMFNGTPLFNNIISGAFNSDRPQNFKFEQAIYFDLPFDYQQDFNGYLVLFFFNWYISYICTCCFCIIDLLLSLMVFHVWGHLRILIHNLEQFPIPKKDISSNKNYNMYSKKEIVTVSQLLREYIVNLHHIREFVSKMSDTFGSTLLIYFAFQQVVGCLVLLECSQMDTKSLVRYGPLTVILFQQLIQISVVFELIGILGEKLSDAVYSIPWECMDTSNRQIFCIYLKQSQTSMNIKAMDMVNVGVQTMTAIIKTAFSYFIMLRTFADVE